MDENVEPAAASEARNPGKRTYRGGKNPYGRGTIPWMPGSELRRLAKSGMTLDEIAAENFRLMGWRPDRGTLSKKLREVGNPPRRRSSMDLIPWTVRTEHNGHLFRRMLDAQSRTAEAGTARTPRSSTDQKLTKGLLDLLRRNGRRLVIGYDWRIGFYLDIARDDDEEFVRPPSENAPRYDDPILQAIWGAEAPEQDRYAALAAVRALKSP